LFIEQPFLHMKGNNKVDIDYPKPLSLLQ